MNRSPQKSDVEKGNLECMAGLGLVWEAGFRQADGPDGQSGRVNGGN